MCLVFVALEIFHLFFTELCNSIRVIISRMQPLGLIYAAGGNHLMHSIEDAQKKRFSETDLLLWPTNVIIDYQRTAKARKFDREWRPVVFQICSQKER